MNSLPGNGRGRDYLTETKTWLEPLSAYSGDRAPEMGQDLKMVQKRLSQASCRTTQLYAHKTEANVRDLLSILFAALIEGRKLEPDLISYLQPDCDPGGLKKKKIFS